ncbi:MAG TPA: hypothetical protein PK817_12905, partial [Dokdonella sp.]|nr:hypothetical protein [Dokdonella sp.]
QPSKLGSTGTELPAEQARLYKNRIAGPPIQAFNSGQEEARDWPGLRRSIGVDGITGDARQP